WSYAEERQAAHRAKSSRRARLSGRQAYRYVLTFLCSLVDPGLVIHPTHRAVRLTATPEEWGKLIAPHSTMQRVSSLSGLLTKVRAKSEHSGMGLVLEGGKLFWLKPKRLDSSLPVVALHEGILKDVPLEQSSY